MAQIWNDIEPCIFHNFWYLLLKSKYPYFSLKGNEGDITRTLIKHFSANDDVTTASFDMIEYIEAGFQYEVVLIQDAETLEKEANKLQMENEGILHFCLF